MWFSGFGKRPAETSPTIEPVKIFILLPSFSTVPNKRTRKAFMACRVPYDVSGICSFQLIKFSDDVHPNPGPFRTGKKFPCGECQKSVRSNQDAILCATCDQWFHVRCIGMVKQVFKYYLENYHLDWECAFCSLPKFSDSFLDETGNETLTEINSTHNDLNYNVAVSLNKAYPRDDDENYLQQAAQLLNSLTKDLKIAHLNVCSIRNKIDVLRVLQSICRFDIIAIKETHLDSSISNSHLNIDGMKIFRRDRTKGKGGGCIMFCAEYLKVTHRKDLASKDLEAIWVQIKFPTTSALFSVIYRSD